METSNLIEYFPDRWRSLREVQAICDADITPAEEGDRHTIQHLWDCMEIELNNAFILPYENEPGAEEYACSRWESMLKIVPANDMTLDDRQFNIRTKLFQVAPYTYRSLQKTLSALIDESGFEISRDVGAKILTVKIAVSNRFKAQAISELLDRIVPADMLLNVEIIYTTHDHMSAYTHDELSTYTHDELKTTQLYNEV